VVIFNSYAFICFFAVVFCAYWLLRAQPRAQNLFLLAASYMFYGWWDWKLTSLLAVNTAIHYAAGIAISRTDALGKKRFYLALAAISGLGILGAFKYYGFFAENLNLLLGSMEIAADLPTLKIILPIGISYYTLQSLGYSIDVYRRKIKPERNLIDFGLFISLFPQLVAGPIERAETLLPQIKATRRWNTDHFLWGLSTTFWGFFKKIVVADNIGAYADQIFTLKAPGIPLLLAGSLAFALQIYADFSGYTDIARGTARCLGFMIRPNFNAPYLAISPSDFWRRWHMSFSTWIRDYLYIPLGGSRQGLAGYTGALLFSMAMSGLWHGARWRFVVWGLYHGALIFVYRLLGFYGKWRPSTKLGLVFAWVLMSFFTLFGWTIFRCHSLSWLGRILTGHNGYHVSADEWSVSIMIVFLIALFALPVFAFYMTKRFARYLSPLQPIIFGLAALAMLVLSRDYAQNFIYFRF